MDVSGKNVIVTGSTKGIGRGIANAMAKCGANVVIVSRHQDECDAVAKELEGKYTVKAVGIAADLTRQGDIDHLVEKTAEIFGRIDVLVNNAGSAVTCRAEDLTPEDYYKVVNLDMNAVFFCAQAVGRRMIAQKGGVIINVASILGMVADKQVLPYLMAKGGVMQMTKGLAVEWAQHNIRVNTICPGYVVTEINQSMLSNEKVAEGLLRKTAMKRFGRVEEIAGTAVFLASDESSYMTGTQIVIDGGWTAQ